MKAKIKDILPFNDKSNNEVKKFILPDLKLLKSPSKNEIIAKKMKILMKSF